MIQIGMKGRDWIQLIEMLNQLADGLHWNDRHVLYQSGFRGIGFGHVHCIQTLLHGGVHHREDALHMANAAVQ